MMQLEYNGINISQDMTVTFDNFGSDFFNREFTVSRVKGSKFSVVAKKYWDIKDKPVRYGENEPMVVFSGTPGPFKTINNEGLYL